MFTGSRANFDTGHDFGEKTVMFSTNDASMDMTQSHTVNIADDADISLQNFGSLTTMDISLSRNGNIGSVSLPNSRNMDLRVEKSNASSSALTLDAGFESFLASLSKPSEPSVNPVIPTMTPAASTERTNVSAGQLKTQRADVGKENQAPTSVPAVMEKSLGTSRKIGELSYGNALCPGDDSRMDMTEAQTGRILGRSDDDDPFQCLFPTQEMYSRLDSRGSQTKEKTTPQQISKPQASLNPQDMIFPKNPSLKDFNQRHKDHLDTADECREKTIMFTAGDEMVDMTQSHTVNIGLFAPSDQDVDAFHTRGKMDYASSQEERKRDTLVTPGLSANGLNLGFKNFLSSFATPGAASGRPAIAQTVPSTAASSRETVDTNSSLSQLKSPVDVKPKESLKKPEITSRQQHNAALGSSTLKGMDTSLTAFLKEKVQKHQVNFDNEDDCREKTVRFSADDACIEVTRSHTVNIDTDLQPQSPQNVDFLPACGEKTETIPGCEPRNQTCTISEEMENSPVKHDVEAAPSRKSRRMSLADLQTKVRRLSHIINAAPVPVAMEACTAPLPRLQRDTDDDSKDEVERPPVPEAELETGLVNMEEKTHDQSLMQGEQPCTATTFPTPFNLKTKQLMSRLSVGSFKAKLPQRGKDPKKQNSAGEHTRTATVNVTNKLSSFDDDLSNIYNEELGSFEDMSETLDVSPQRAAGKGLHVDELEDAVFTEDSPGSGHGKKRPLPADENNMEDEKRMKTSTGAPTDAETVGHIRGL
ncbi:hypothetical protein EYF80_029109 [Liparis tanakae]|uniref:Uncharacterized protein n=1 Tax=Liparis tanakae TaxID=230148 RepID=A0A4Z2H4B2_9TELE|nr:hypothetical protein EYF80_029109 [Liparis tanakae]